MTVSIVGMQCSILNHSPSSLKIFSTEKCENSPQIGLLYGIKSKAVISLPFDLHFKAIAALFFMRFYLFEEYISMNGWIHFQNTRNNSVGMGAIHFEITLGINKNIEMTLTLRNKFVFEFYSCTHPKSTK